MMNSNFVKKEMMNSYYRNDKWTQKFKHKNDTRGSFVILPSLKPKLQLLPLSVSDLQSLSKPGTLPSPHLHPFSNITVVSPFFLDYSSSLQYRYTHLPLLSSTKQ